MRDRLSVALAGAIALATTAGPAVAAPTLSLVKYIAVPADTATNVQPGGAFSAFDISYADPVTGDIFIADRSNAGVDIFSGSSLTFLGRATGFAGQQATTSVSGPDGVLTVTSGGTTTLYAGDGDSTLKVINATNPLSPTQLQSISTGGSTRVDEMAYSPTAHLVLAANNAETPAYGNLFSTSGPPGSPATLIASHITVPAAQGGITTGGMEQPVWDPNTGTFFVSIPALAGTNNPGGVAEISTTGVVLRTIDFGTMGISKCGPAGLAVGASGNLMVGCSAVGAGAIVLNPTGAGSIVKTFAGVGGTDELWYDPTTKDFYVTGSDGTNSTRFFDVITDNLLGGIIADLVNLPVTTSAHSIAVDPFNGDVFVPLAGTSAVDPCPVSFANPGCIAVFAAPEPGSMPLLVVGLAGLMALAVRRRVHSG
ncbi:MAG TPA: PEP-CTERM sorting domain-containing protein [Acetobacteraceae bacterium]